MQKEVQILTEIFNFSVNLVIGQNLIILVSVFVLFVYHSKKDSEEKLITSGSSAADFFFSLTVKSVIIASLFLQFGEVISDFN